MDEEGPVWIDVIKSLNLGPQSAAHGSWLPYVGHEAAFTSAEIAAMLKSGAITTAQTVIGNNIVPQGGRS